MNEMATPSQSASSRHVASSETRTRVALFTNSITWGGMEEHVVLLARHLDRAHFEVFGIIPDLPSEERLKRSVSAVVDDIAIATPDRRFGIGRLIPEMMRLYRQLRTWRIDVLHMHSTTYRGQLFALIAARLAGVKRIYVTEHLAPGEPLPVVGQWVRNVFSELVSGVICVSNKNLIARRKFIHTPAKSTFVVDNGIDVAQFNPIPADELARLRAKHAIPPDAKVVGTAVRFEPEKGLEYLVDAMPAIRAAIPNVHLLMVGDGSLRSELEAHVARLNLADRVHFVGFQSDPRPYLGLMDVFALPVPFGSMSIGLLEAMAMERAVVMTFGGEGEAVVDGVTGLTAQPRDPASIATAISSVLLDDQFRDRLGKAARQRIIDHFSAERVARELSELYRTHSISSRKA